MLPASADDGAVSSEDRKQEPWLTVAVVCGCVLGRTWLKAVVSMMRIRVTSQGDENAPVSQVPGQHGEGSPLAR